MSKNSNNSQNAKKQLLKWAGFIFVGLIIYFGNKSMQTYFGEQALQKIDFEILDIDVAIAKADAHEKLVLADMSAIWCPTCRKLDRTIFASEEVKQVIEEHFVFARVEYESAQGEAFMQKYRVAGFPVLLVLDGEGEKLTRLPLTFETKDFISNLEMILAMQKVSETATSTGK